MSGRPRAAGLRLSRRPGGQRRPFDPFDAFAAFFGRGVRGLKASPYGAPGSTRIGGWFEEVRFVELNEKRRRLRPLRCGEHELTLPDVIALASPRSEVGIGELMMLHRIISALKRAPALPP